MKAIAHIIEDGKVVGIIDGPDVINQSVRALGKTWRFDFDEHFGPLWTRKDGTGLKNQNPPKAVWDAFGEWHDNYMAERGTK